MKRKKDEDHEHFANDDPTEFDHDETENLAKEAIKNSNHYSNMLFFWFHSRTLNAKFTNLKYI